MSKSSKFSWQNPKARYGYKIMALLLIAYGAASWGIDNGSLWLYFVTFGACYMIIHYATQLIGEFRRDRRG